ncbi:IS630 family transposase [Streptosporangium canum]|uniref:IS630 family transposase n=1 Tax=Streptosporangium canum TaxID=324952 RepID=UPI0034174984
MVRSGPQAVQIILSDGERDQLTQLAACSSKLAWRARVVLACAEPGSSNAGVAAAMGATPDTVRKWRSRFAGARLAGLADEARSGRPKAELTLSDDERATLTRWARRASSAQALAQRSRIVLACADGVSNAEAAARLRVGAHMVAKWRRRFIELRLEGLIDEPRPGRPPTIRDGQVEQVVIDTLESTPKDATHWSRASMAKRSGLSPSTVGRIWKAFRLKPHRAETFKLSKDPLFIEKVHDVVGLYLHPPEHAVVLCADEKSQVQALDRSQPVLPMMPGMPERRTHDYVRHGTSSLFAAFDIADGKVIASMHRRHRSVEWLKFLKKIDREVPSHLHVHIVCDNYGTHKTPAVQTWLAGHPRFHMHFTPTSASWLNQVERWFGLITDKLIRRGVHTSVTALEKDILAWVDIWNEDPRPFVWVKTAEEILTSIELLLRRIKGEGQ